MNNNPGRTRSSSPVIVIIIIIAIAVTSLLLFRSLSQNLVENITRTISLQHSRELNAQMTANISNSLDFFFYELNTEYNSLKLVDNLDEEKLRDFISDVETENGISYLAFADEDGYVYEASGSYLGTMRVSVLKDLLSGAERVVTDNQTIGNESYIVIGTCFSTPVQLKDRNLCIGIMGMTSEDLEKKVILQSDYSGGYSSIINQDGSFIVKNPAEPFAGLNVFSILKKNSTVSDEELSELQKAIQNGETYILSTKESGGAESAYMYFAPVEDIGWYAVNTLPSSFIGSSIADLQKSLIAAYGVFILFIFFASAIVIIQQENTGRKLKESQKELEKALKLAEDASKAKTAFLFNMSHDIRTPMNAILGYTDIGLMHTDDPVRANESFKKIKTSSKHLLNLINDILEMSRIESGKLELVEHELDIQQAIDGINTMSQTLAMSKSIDFKTDAENIKNRYIYADELHVNEVIINLISNAVKYTQSGGKVRYTISQLGDPVNGKATYRFEVSDNGYGMSEDFQNHLFETFSRESNSTISKIEGTGIGLSIVKQIVDLAGGTISVVSTLHKGSTFTVDFPFRVMDEAATEKFKKENSPVETIKEEASLEGSKVLLVEDNEINREIATIILEEAGLVVEEAEDGLVAVNILKEKGVQYYDFILMDIQMPMMDGYEATMVIRNMPDGDKAKIIALSANAFEEDRQKSLSAGMNAHVAKPIDIKLLLETMNMLAD